MSRRKETIFEFICSDLYVPMKLKEIASVLNIPKKDRADLENVLAGLMDEGRLELTKRGKYIKAEGNYIRGRYVGSQKGYGFIEREDSKEDLFIPEEHTNGAMHGDEVLAALLPRGEGKRPEGTVIKILVRAVGRIVGTFEKSPSFGFVRPDNHKFDKDIFIPQEWAHGAVTGHKVVAEITDYGNKDKKPEGRIIEILGHSNDPGTDILSIIKGYDIPIEFPERVVKQAVKVSNPVSSQDMAGRMDLRDWPMVTIDGEDAKDLDDAVSLTKEANRYILGVHIADVTNYVQERSALDTEALERGTSVYLVDRVIPMLPHTLSNGICSLNAGEDRLALSCIMTIDEKGAVVDHKIAESVIHVDQRMTYTSVKKILTDQDPVERSSYESFVPMFERMEELAAVLREKRRQRGSIDFDFPETKILLDEAGRPREIKPYERNVATKIIEDFMLIANETVAQDYFWQELPFVYRTHDNPDSEKIKKLAAFIHNFGLSIKLRQEEEIHPKELQKLLGRIEDTPQEALISRLILRSMKQAKYSTMGTGHFGLSTPYYCHFTSPIRRYPDLQIHRIIKENIRGRMNEKRLQHYEEILPKIAAHASKMERRAEEAERETLKLKKVEYMTAHIGETFAGVISGITNWGLYVELPNTVEGMIHVTRLTDDYYHYEESSYELVGESTGKRYKLGQQLTVVVAATDCVMRTIDFEPVDQGEEWQRELPEKNGGREEREESQWGKKAGS